MHTLGLADTADSCLDKNTDLCQVILIRPKFQLHFAELHCLSGKSVITTRFWQHNLCIQPHAMQVDVSEEEDQFQAVTTACLNVLILAVETRLDVALQQMTRMPWATLETVSPAWCTSAGDPVSCIHSCLPHVVTRLVPPGFASMSCYQVLPSGSAIRRHMCCSSLQHATGSDRMTIVNLAHMCAKGFTASP